MELILYLVKSIGILSLFLLLYVLLLRRDTSFTANRHFLITGIALALLLPFIEFTKTIYIPHNPLETATVADYNVPLQYTSSIAEPENALTLDWWQVISFIYVIGIAFFTLRILLQLFSLYRLIKSGEVICHDTHVYIAIKTDVTPFSFFSYIVYNPNLHTREELKMIFEHERVHARQWHSLDILLMQLLLAVHWCNPIAWLYKKNVEQNLEYIADSEAIKNINNPKQYQRALVKVSSPIYRPALTNQFYKSFIKKRIIMLNKPQTRKQSLWKLGLALPFLAIFMYSFQVKEVVEYEMSPDVDVSSAFAKAKEKTSIPEPLALDPETAEKENEKAVTTPRPKLAKKTILQTAPIMQDPYRFKITKNTTIEELKALKKMLKKDHDATLKYSDVDFNNAGEITSIRIDFKDANGNNKNYTLQGDTPIADIFIYSDADGRTGMGNASSKEEVEDLMEERREEMMEKREEIILRGNAQKASSRTRTDSLRKVMMYRRDSLRNSRGYGAKDSIRLQMQQRREEMRTEMQQRRLEGRARMKDQIVEMEAQREKMTEATMKLKQLQKGNDSGSLSLKNGDTYFFVIKDGKTVFYDRLGNKVEKEDSIHKKLRKTLSGN